jgi:hypothetical protein
MAWARVSSALLVRISRNNGLRSPTVSSFDPITEFISHDNSKRAGNKRQAIDNPICAPDKYLFTIFRQKRGFWSCENDDLRIHCLGAGHVFIGCQATIHCKAPHGYSRIVHSLDTFVNENAISQVSVNAITRIALKQ